MNKNSLRALLMAATLVVSLMATASPALADPDAGLGPIVKKPAIGADDSTSDNDGDADADSSTGYTEDNDTNDGTANNVEDDGDNAQPSGKDRSVENGGSGNQGKAESNPDDSKGPQRYEGARGDDKPNGPGGNDLADQDGNNGCGNDDDFDDDNNGWCGKPGSDDGPDNSCSENGNRGWECTGGPGDQTGGSTSPTGCPNKHMGTDGKGNGANESGAYDSTCDGSPSGNGNGGGNAGGKPCAGCVGNADDKNPPGQAPDGSDDNKGYECDENSGVGRTNPAHTGCAAPAVEGTTTLCPAGTDMAGLPPGASGCNEEEVLGRTDKACPKGTENAGKPMDELKDCEDNSVLGKVLRNSGPLGSAVKKASAALGAVLPFTGNGDVMAFLVIALALIAGGVFLLLKKRKVTA